MGCPSSINLSVTLNIHSRPYGGSEDLTRMIAFVQMAAGHRDNERSINYLHCGDLTWRMYRALDFKPHQHIHLWESAEGELIGFAWFYENHNGVDLQVHPDWRGRGIGLRMIRWAEQVARRQRLSTVGGGLRLNCFDHDLIRQASLMQAGYRPDSFHYVHFGRSLDDLFSPSATLRDERYDRFLLRSVEPNDVVERARLHDAAFFATEVTSDSYRNVMRSAGYRPELDVVAVDSDGSFAAFALCWADPATKVGLFEPVGTHPTYRRLGLARAVIIEGLKRLKAAGMESVWVYTESPNLPAQRLYASLDFKITAKQFDYIKS